MSLYGSHPYGDSAYLVDERENREERNGFHEPCIA
jgi:hypothetical protein